MSSSSRRNDNMLDIYEKFRQSCDFSNVGKLLGKGAFGEVRDISYKNKTMAGKLIKRENDEKSEEEKYGVDLRGQNIIKINKVYTKKIEGNTYDLIIMEKAILRDLGKLSEFYHRHNLLKLIYFPFDEPSGDCLLRFYARQIINALETLDRNYFVHNDIKPENLLISVNLIVKLSDFSLLTKIKNGISTKIPGGTQGYLTPEYYIERNVSSEDARKQDYFALGSTLFYLKYGQQMLKYKKSDINVINSFFVLDSIQKQISFIESQQMSDKDFIDFLCSLINYRPKDRPSFEEIYRNKWLNKDVNCINEIFYTYENDEEKLIMELQKKDFLLKKEKELNNELFGDEKNKLIDKNKEREIQGKHCRFIFKKKNIH